MTDSNLLPFGKYKGRMIEQVLADDPAYLQWCAGQDWFRARFNVLYQVIINRGGEPEESPEHNTLQVKFLDDNFCLRFLRHLVPDYRKQICADANDARESNRTSIAERHKSIVERMNEAQKDAKSDTPRYQFYSVEEWRKRALKEYEECQTQALSLSRLQQQLVTPINDVKLNIGRAFEWRGVDVVLSFETELAKALYRPTLLWEVERNLALSWSTSYWAKKYCIELKPTIGDDYPAILRQMRANGSDVLLVGSYTGVGATREQFVGTFTTAAIKVVFATAVEAE